MCFPCTALSSFPRGIIKKVMIDLILKVLLVEMKIDEMGIVCPL